MISLREGKIKKVFFYRGKQVFIIHMITDEYEGYHFKIVDRCNKSETYSVPFKYASECEQVSTIMIKEGRI